MTKPDAGPASSPELLVLHGVRVLGAPRMDEIAARLRLPLAVVREQLLDDQALGLVTRYDFGEVTWSLTERGRAENERRLAAELDATGARAAVQAGHAAFLRLNARHGEACTRWQLRPQPWDRAAANDHSDPDWDDAVLAELEELDRALRAVGDTLTAALARFEGHAERHQHALARVRQGRHEWLDGPGRASVQLVWIQLHEDLLATLGIPRGSDG